MSVVVIVASCEEGRAAAAVASRIIWGEGKGAAPLASRKCEG